jgi:hypothetical protein
MLKFLPTVQLLFLVVFLHISVSTQGQNILPNPSFEQHVSCPVSYNQSSVLADWTAGNASTPDYYNCSYYGISVQAAPSVGSGVLGVWGGAQHPSCPTSAYTENVTADLSQPLLVGHSYELSFDVQIDGNGFGSANPNDCIRVGAYFYNSAQAPVLTGVCSPTIEPQAFVMGSMVQKGNYQRFTFTINPTDTWDMVLLGTFQTPASAGGTCANYTGNRMYFNLDNLEMTESILLPASLLAFNGRLQDAQVQLDWKLAEAGSLSEVLVERCNGNCDDAANFTPINKISTTDQQDFYSYLDTRPQAGRNYYRLRMVGDDQAETLSEVLSFSIQTAGPQLLLYPNPAAEQLSLMFTLTQQEAVILSIQDLQGRTLWQEQKMLSAGNNLIKVPVAHFAAGAYLMVLETESGSQRSVKRWVRR